MKDINDLWMLLTAAQPIDWGSVEELCRQAGAVPALRQLLSVTNNVYAHTEQLVPEVLGYGMSRRAQGHRIARLTYADERTRGARPWRAMRTAMTARRYYTTDLDPRPVRTGADPAPNAGVRRRDVCWRLLPPETWSRFPVSGAPRANHTGERLATDLTVIRSAQGSVIRMIDEVFVPTVWGRVSPDSVALARQVTGA